MSRDHFYIPSSKVSTFQVRKGLGGVKYTRENYSDHGQQLVEQFAAVKSELEMLNDVSYSENIYSKIKSPEKIKLTSVKNELRRMGLFITRIDPKNSSIGYGYFKKSRLLELENTISNYANLPNNPKKSYLKFLEGMTSVQASDKLQVNLDSDDSEKLSYVLHLQSEVSEENADVLIGLIKDEFSITSNVDKFFLDDSLKTISVQLDKKELLELCNRYSLIQSVSINSRVVLTQSIQSESIQNDLIINSDPDNPTVIVIDSGITNLGLMAGLVKSTVQVLPFGTVGPEYNHGTFVASRIAFGDDLDRSVTSRIIKSYCNVIDFAIFGNSISSDGLIEPLGPQRQELCNILCNAVEKFKDQSRVINLSLSDGIAIEDSFYSDSAFVIDYLSRKYDVIFVIAAGNIDSLLGAFPDDHFKSHHARICSPAESVLGITVGSIAKHEDYNALSVLNQVSPFSRRGPGFNMGLKPELVHHGGNLLNNYCSYARIATSGLFNTGKHLATDNGTSFSAPLVSQIAARLFAHYEGQTANLIKALMIHFTDIAVPHNVCGLDNNYQVGFGIPNYKKAIEAGGNSATYLYEGKVKNDHFQVIKFYIPKILSSDNSDTKLRIKVTVVSNPPTNRNDISQYIQSRLTFSLEKLNKDCELMNVSLTAEDKKIADWSPIQQFEKSFTRAYSTGEWQLKVRCWTRGDLQDDFEQEFAVIIEIIDDNGTGDPYQEILTETGSTYFKEINSIDRAA